MKPRSRRTLAMVVPSVAAMLEATAVALVARHARDAGARPMTISTRLEPWKDSTLVVTTLQPVPAPPTCRVCGVSTLAVDAATGEPTCIEHAGYATTPG